MEFHAAVSQTIPVNQTESGTKTTKALLRYQRRRVAERDGLCVFLE